MADTDTPDQEMIDNLPLLFVMDVLKAEKDWKVIESLEHSKEWQTDKVASPGTEKEPSHEQ